MTDKPKNAWELCETSGLKPDEGVVITIFPPKLTELAATGEDYYYAQWVRVRGILANFGEGLGTRVIDLLPDPVETKIKWWKVRDFARGAGYDLVPERWNGAARDIPRLYFDMGDEAMVGVRLYSAGPWFWPWGRPEMVLEEDPDAARMAEVADAYKL